MPEKENKSGRFAYDGLSRIFHEKARLSIMTSLLTSSDGLLFTELKELCSLTDGNLSRHIQHLQEEGLVNVFKGFKNKRPQTLCRLTDSGKKQFIDYLIELEKVIKDASAASMTEYKVHDNNSIEGWLSA